MANGSPGEKEFKLLAHKISRGEAGKQEYVDFMAGVIARAVVKDVLDDVAYNDPPRNPVVKDVLDDVAYNDASTIQRYQSFATEDRMIGANSIQGNHLAFYALGIAGEGGEVADKVKKGLRRDYNIDLMTTEQRKSIGLELGDTLWYLVNAANELGYTLSEIMEMNIDKLEDRRSRGKSRGEGDNR